MTKFFEMYEFLKDNSQQNLVDFLLVLAVVLFILLLFAFRRLFLSFKSTKKDLRILQKLCGNLDVVANEIKLTIDDQEKGKLLIWMKNLEELDLALTELNNPFLVSKYRHNKKLIRNYREKVLTAIEKNDLHYLKLKHEKIRSTIVNSKRFVRYSDILRYKSFVRSLISDLKEQKFKYIREDIEIYIDSITNELSQLDQQIYDQNIRYIENEKKLAKSLFFNNDGKAQLTEEQINAVISDNDRELVIAGAGSGKTRVIDFKVRYLVNHKSVDPNRVILLSFSRKSANDLVEKISASVPGIKAKTIHSFCIPFLGEDKRDIVQPGEQRKFVLDSLASCLEDAKIFKKFFDFYNDYFTDVKPLIFYDNINDLRKDLKKLNSKLVNVNDQFEEVKPRRTFLTLKGDYVRSVDERYIADFLFLQDIEYVYEGKYPHCKESYYPDFYLSQYDIYLEHYAITKNGTPPPTFKKPQKYLDGMKWKKDVHSRNNTKLIESYSHELNNRESTYHYLANLLSKSGVKIESSIDKLQAYRKLSRRFADFFQKFYNLFKLSGKSIEDLQSTISDPASVLFLSVFEKFFSLYESKLKYEHKLDFTDLIIYAKDRLAKEGGQSYDYIIVDEFQDTSNLAMSFLNEVFRVSEKPCFFSVGDDWQSIYGFNGSDVSIMSDYSHLHDGVSSHKLTSNFRSHSRIVSLGNEFVRKNPSQIEKEVTSGNQSFESSEVDFLDFKNMESKILEIPENESVFVLYRYNDDCPAKRGLFKDMFFLNKNGKPVKRKGVKKKISLMTIHASKGLEARHVFLLFPNGMNRKFPSETVDHFVFNMLKHNREDYPFAEERRLMYVAITRAEQNLYFVSSNGKDPNSVFWDELKEIVMKDRR